MYVEMNKVPYFILFLCAIFLSENHLSAQAAQSAVEQTGLFTIADFLIDDQHSYVGFKVKYFGFSPVRGRFNEFKGHLLYDENDLSKTSVTLFMDIRTINTGVGMRDDDLKGDHWFHTDSFPQASFQSKRAIPLDDGGFQLIGELTIKSITRETTLTFDRPTALSKDYAGNDQVDFSGKTTIRRSEFDITGDGFWNSEMEGGLQQLADEVVIELDIHCRRPDYNIRYRDLEADNIRKIAVDEFVDNGIAEGLTLLEKLRIADDRKDKPTLTSGALRTIGYILLNKNKQEEALAVFQKKASWFPDSKSNQVDLAKAYAAKNDRNKTRHYLLLATEANPQHGLALEWLRWLGE